MKPKRRTWQHIFEDVSEDQLSELLHYSLEWVVERIGRDYGEDLYVRIFEGGNPTGHDFYIQLKGTDNIEQYALKTSPHFSYGISIENLAQWKDFTLPVIIVLWDIKQKRGFWVHAQPLIIKRLQDDQTWLQNTSKAKEPKRKILIPRGQMLDKDNSQLLKGVINREYTKTKLGRHYFESIHQEKTEVIKKTLIRNARVESLEIASLSSSLPPSVEQQLLITQYKAMTLADPSNYNAWLELARIHYEISRHYID